RSFPKNRRLVGRIAFLLLILPAPAQFVSAQNPAVTITVNATANRHAIDPRVYGLAYADAAALADLNCPLTRRGGNNTTRYNWQQNADNRGADWYFESIAYGSATAGDDADAFVAAANGANAKAM